MTLFDHLIVFIFVIVYPAYDYFYSTPKFKKNALKNIPKIRIHEFQKGIAWIWILSILTLAVWLYNERSLVNLGLDISILWSVWLGLILLIMGLIYILYIYKTIKKDTAQRSNIKTKMNATEASIYLHQTKDDFMWFIPVAISAGICEELLFRGFLMWYINEFSSIILAIILSSILFGLAHSFQGWKGVIQSGLS